MQACASMQPTRCRLDLGEKCQTSTDHNVKSSRKREKERERILLRLSSVVHVFKESVCAYIYIYIKHTGHENPRPVCVQKCMCVCVCVHVDVFALTFKYIHGKILYTFRDSPDIVTGCNAIFLSLSLSLSHLRIKQTHTLNFKKRNQRYQNKCLNKPMIKI